MRLPRIGSWLRLFGALALVSATGLTGCGYTTRSMIAGRYHTVYVEPFKNKIDITRETTANDYRMYRPMLETDLTQAVIQKFLTDGNLKPVDIPENADLALEGALISFSKDPLRYTRDDEVEEYRVNITVALKMTEASTGAVLWEEPSFTGYATYFVTGARATSEASAISEAVLDLSRRIIERTVDQW